MTQSDLFWKFKEYFDCLQEADDLSFPSVSLEDITDGFMEEEFYKAQSRASELKEEIEAFLTSKGITEGDVL